MQFFDDGRVGMSFEPSGGTIRFLPEPAADGHPTYCAVGTLTMLSATVAKLAALHGDVSARHMALMVRALDAMGVRALYVERTHGAIPLGERIESGDFAEWFRVDVAAAAKRARERYKGAAVTGAASPAASLRPAEPDGRPDAPTGRGGADRQPLGPDVAPAAARRRS